VHIRTPLRILGPSNELAGRKHMHRTKIHEGSVSRIKVSAHGRNWYHSSRDIACTSRFFLQPWQPVGAAQLLFGAPDDGGNLIRFDVALTVAAVQSTGLREWMDRHVPLFGGR